MSDLGISHALHSTQYGVDKNNAHADYQAGRNFHFEKSGENNANSAHLAGDVGKRNEDQANDGNDPRRLRIVTFSDKLRDGELAKLAQVRRKQQRQQNVTTGPAHEVHRTVIAEKCDEACHRDKRCCAHPVGGGRHAVCDRRDALTGNIKVTGVMRARPDGDAYIEHEAQSDHDPCQPLKTHERTSVFMDVMFAINAIHTPGVKENQQYEDIDRSLLREPEAELESAEANGVELLDKKDAEAK